MNEVSAFLDDAQEALELALAALAALEGQEDQELLVYMVGADLTQLKRTIKAMEESK